MKAIELTGRRFGRLVVNTRGDNTPQGLAKWLCSCDCGGIAVVRGADLRNGHTRSCGCIYIESAAAIAEKHTKTHGQSGAAIYAVWRGMLSRCGNTESASYPRYGGRGISVCERWKCFEVFFEDFGKCRPSPRHSIDRIDNDGGYEPGNVRWALPVVQQNNRSNNVTIEFEGVRLSTTQWARRVGITGAALAWRIANGWPIHLALREPANPGRRIEKATSHNKHLKETKCAPSQ